MCDFGNGWWSLGGVCAAYRAPFGLLRTRRRGRKPAQISSLAETRFLLDGCADFWESRDCHIIEIPYIVPTARPASGGLFCFLGVDFLPERLRCGANQFARGASLLEKPAAFKRADTPICGVGAGCRSSRCRKIPRSCTTTGSSAQPGLNGNSGADPANCPGFSMRSRGSGHGRAVTIAAVRAKRRMVSGLIGRHLRPQPERKPMPRLRRFHCG
jgi:hypothetical protein